MFGTMGRKIFLLQPALLRKPVPPPTYLDLLRLQPASLLQPAPPPPPLTCISLGSALYTGSTSSSGTAGPRLFMLQPDPPPPTPPPPTWISLGSAL